MLTGTEEVYHPDPEKGKLPPQPILLVATSDDALRLFSFARLKRSAEGITHAALPYSEASYPMVAQAASQVGLLLMSWVRMIVGILRSYQAATLWCRLLVSCELY